MYVDEAFTDLAVAILEPEIANLAALALFSQALIACTCIAFVPIHKNSCNGTLHIA